MPSTEASAAAWKGGRKRGRGRPPAGSRARKKQKRLDAIVDKPAAAVPAAGEDPTLLRRSCRVRRAPQVLDASPLPSIRRRPRPKLGEAPVAKPSRNLSSGTPRPKEEEEEDGKEEEMGDWRSRLRSRAGKGKGSGPLAGKREIHLEKLEQPSIEEKEKESLNPESNEIKDSVDLQPLGSRRRRKRGSDDDILEDAGQSGDQHAILPTIDQEDGVGKAPVEEEIKVPNDSLAGSEEEKEEETAEESQEERNEAETMHEDEQGESNHPVAEETALQQLGNVHTGDGVNIHLEENPDGKTSESDDTVKEAPQSEDIVKEDSLKLPDLNNGPDKPRMKEGRRCGLCGGGTDGRPPKKLAQESTDSDKEAYEGSSASEEPNYDVWDGFGDEPGWLGRLLGPIHDRFGIARVWVHQHCAVWSPEVYFAGLGCLKNVRAALCRGRALKCSRCGRPGATIGCRVDRCPKTYHLPCSRAEGCIFDHRKFLIACSDHRHLFQPQGNNYAEHIRKMKAKKLKSDLRKISNDAFRKDLEAEEKWLENCGEDEEFLRREGKRLHRDLSRIAPIYIGGSSENDKSYQGWESVAGLQDVIQCMKEVVIIPLLYPEFFSNMGLTPPRGVLLHGYPGTGKTLVVRALIGACSRGEKQIAYFARKGADCLGKYVGDAERQLRLLFQVAERSQPSIIFFDEIDGLAPRRSGHQDQTHSSVVSTLLSLLDGLKSRGSVIVIGATNRPDAVDPALRRPGRFDREIYFPLPSVKDRHAILSLHTKNWPNPIPKPLLSWIASQTAGYAGADLQSLCTQAAMNALKRNCALQEILSSAEKASGHGRPPHLPSFVVEERDWLAALEFASPPCSRRESGMAANDVVSSPLHAHLFPCLLGPLLHLLISLYIDERIKLPPSLLKASESIRTVIFSSLEQKGIPVGFWWLHLHSLIQEPYVAKEIEKNLSCHGLLIDRSGYFPSYALDDDIDDHCKFGSCKPVQKFPVRLQRTLGFRALIAGIPRSGQQHLASCLLHGFMGHIEIQKINLATIAQEGHGDIIRGLTQILLKCMSVERCIIYMPRIDLWAIDDTSGEAEEGKISPKRSKSFLTLGVHGATKYASEMWSSFVEQVNSVCTSASIIILATCEVPNHDLPDEIRQFFSGNVLNRTDSAPSENSTPRFSVHLDGNFDLDLVINSAAAKLSKDLVQHYVQLVYHRTHMVSSHDGNKVSHTPEVDSRAQKQSMQSEWPTEALDTSADSERAVSNIAVCCRDKRTQQGVNNYTSLSAVPKVIGNQEVSVQLPNFQDSFPKFLSSKIKGTSSLIIATFGYQILRYPQFAELCWVTSKLKDGPCTDINGPLKGWPFNTCITRISSSPGKAVAGASSSNLKDKESSVMVRGLVAVGLMAYRGVYTSVREVSLEVRKVLDLLVGHIRAKILGRKDRYRYLRLLSQVAYLEDMVNSWVYAFQSLPVDDQVAASTTKHVDAGRPWTGNNMSDGKPINNDSNMQSAPTKSCEKLQEISDIGSPWKFASSNGESVNASKGSADSVLPNSDMSMTPEVKHCQDLSALASLPTSLHLSSFTAAHALVSGDGVNITEVLTSSNGLESVETDHPIDTNMPNSGSSDLVNRSCSRVVTDKCTCLETVHSVNNGSVPDVGEMFNCTLDKRNNFSLHGISCFYDCCSGCLHVVNELVQNILSDYWNSRGHHSTVDDLHDVIASCSSNVLSGFRKYHNLQSASGIEDGREQNRTFQEEHCACQEVGADQTKGTLFQHKIMRQIKFLPTECSCHIRNKEDIATEKMQSNSLYQPSLKFFFRDGVLISPDPNKDTLFHCGFENLCVCSIIKILLMIKHPSD